ncbi:MAG: hypothetical protein AAB414_05240 [Patescibacteria group bacterium]
MITSTLHVRIISPQQLILDTDALSISSKNLQGNFDILPMHANFITVVENEPIIVRVAKQKPLTFKFKVAIIYTTNNQVQIYTNIESSENLIS